MQRVVVVFNITAREQQREEMIWIFLCVCERERESTVKFKLFPKEPLGMNVLLLYVCIK